MPGKLLSDVRVEEIRLLTQLERAGRPFHEGHDTPMRRLVVHLIAEGYVNGVNQVSWNDHRNTHIERINAYELKVGKEKWGQLATLLAGQVVQIYITHKGSVRRAELEQALMAGRALDPSGLMFDGHYFERDLMLATMNAGAESPVVVAHINLNWLTEITRTYGYAAASAALGVYLQTVRSAIEDVGETYRVRGDDVRVIMTGVSMAEAKARMSSLLASLANEQGKDGHPLTASIGLASTAKADQDAAELATRASSAQAKANARSKARSPRTSWICAEGEEPEPARS